MFFEPQEMNVPGIEGFSCADSLDRTRGDFRNAQLQAKRNAELAKRKERELLLSRSQASSEKRGLAEKFTQEDLVLNASNDVTAALRRTHHLMQAELSRSQFAQETLGKWNSTSSSGAFMEFLTTI